MTEPGQLPKPFPGLSVLASQGGSGSPSRSPTTFRKPGNYPPGHPLYQKPGADPPSTPAAPGSPLPSSSTLKIYSPEEKMLIWARLRKLAETHQKELLTEIFNQHNVPRDGPLAGTLNIEADEDEKEPDEDEKVADIETNADSGVKADYENKQEKKEDFFATTPALGGIRHRSTAQAAFLTRARSRFPALADKDDEDEDVAQTTSFKPLKPLHVKTIGEAAGTSLGEQKASLVECNERVSEVESTERASEVESTERASEIEPTSKLESIERASEIEPADKGSIAFEEAMPLLPELDELPPVPEIPYYTSGESELEDDVSEDDEEEEEEANAIDINDVRSTLAKGALSLRSFPEQEKISSTNKKAVTVAGGVKEANSGVAHLATSTEIRDKSEKAVLGRRVAPQLDSIKPVHVEQIEVLIKSFDTRQVSGELTAPTAIQRKRAVTLIEAQHANETKDLKLMATQEIGALSNIAGSEMIGDEAVNADDKQLFVRLFYQRGKENVASCLIRVEENTKFEDLLTKIHSKASLSSRASQAHTPEQAAKLAHIKEVEKEMDSVSWLRQELKGQLPSVAQRKRLKETHIKLEQLGVVLNSLKEDVATTKDFDDSSFEMHGLYARGVKSNKGQWLSAGVTPFQILEQFNKGDERAILVYTKRKVTLTISINQDVGVASESVVKFESFTFESSLTSEEVVAAVAKFMGMAPQSSSLLNLQIPFPDSRWLEDNVPLYESVGFNPQSSINLSLRSRFFLERIDWIPSDSVAFQFIFSQAVQCVTSGNYNCNQARATLFAALLIFVLSGSYSAFSRHGETEKQLLRRYESLLPTVLPQQFLTSNQSIRVMAKDTRKAHEQLGELGTSRAMLAYLNLMKTGWMDSTRVAKLKTQKSEKVKPKKPGCYEFLCTGKTRNNTNHNLSADINVNERSLALKKVGSGLKQWSCNLPINSIIGVEVPHKDSKLIRLFSFSMGSTDLTFASTQERLAFSSCLQMAISKTADIMNKPQGEMMMQMMTDPAIYQSLAFAQVNFENHLAMRKRVSPPDTAKLSIFIGTYNCGSNGPDNMSWMERGHDVYVWGVQECNYKPRKPHSTCENDWMACMQNHLGSEFMVVKNLSMWEIRLIVMARDVLMPFITNVEAAYEATGLGNVVKNKGGVAIGMTIFETSMAFFNCHLAARPNKGRMKLRNKNMQTIFHSLANKLGFIHYDTLNSFDLVYLLGDLNYRVVGQSREVILENIEKKKYYSLLKNDQLNQQKAAGNIAFTFTEAPITWQPSYRYQTDNNQWSTKKLFNLPSYCDRVLWQACPSVTVNPISYQQNMDILGSDHRPISSVHEVTVRRTIPKEPSELRLCVVRLYGLTVDLYLKEKYLATKRHVLKRLTLTSRFLKEALDIHGECVDDDENEVKDGEEGKASKRDNSTSILPIPKGFRHTSRFLADEIITFSLADIAPRDIDGATLVLTMFLQGSSEPAGHAVVSLKDSCELSGRTSPVSAAGHFTLDGLPQACYFASVVTSYDNPVA